MNKTAIYAAVGLIVLAVILFNPKPKCEKSVTMPGSFKVPCDEEIKSVLSEIASTYGRDTAINVEKVYRAETTHFTSGQYKKAGSPGMLKSKIDYPYGWNVMAKLWENPSFRPVGDTTFTVKGKTYTYLVFPDFKSAAFSLAEYIREYGPLRWNSKDPSAQAKYKALLDSIIPRFCNAILPI